MGVPPEHTPMVSYLISGGTGTGNLKDGLEHPPESSPWSAFRTSGSLTCTLAWVPPASYHCGDTTNSVPSTKVIHQVRNNATVSIEIDTATIWWGSEGEVHFHCTVADCNRTCGTKAACSHRATRCA
ncbi:hypothetical protein ABZ611_20720 [Streptomyces sp. NPDC007861]|uniref:hypothetical protein n=1 Tax=Streptomyces sp. NPDC007861 TaxID=3154893 RepID=UPI0033E47729